jgi:hypothetical protein
LLMQCLDEQGDIIHTIALEERLSNHHLLGIAGNDIPDTDKLRRDIHYPSLVIPVADGSNHSRRTTKVRLGVHLSEWRGVLRIYDLEIKPFRLNADDFKQWEQDISDGIILGACAQEFSKSTYIFSDEPYSQTIEDSGAKLLRTVGMDRYRAFLHWDKLEPIKGKYLFDDFDNTIEALNYYDVDIDLATFHGFPSWVSDISIDNLPEEVQLKMKTHYWTPQFPPSNWNDYEEFVTIMVNRYKDTINKWEIWNEPNGHVFAGDSIQIYKQLLMRFYNIAKKIDPECVVICGRVGSWVPYLVEEGLGDYMDAIASHPYNWRLVNELRTVMTASGIDKPISITEVGYNGGGYPWTGPATFANEQARTRAVETVIPERIVNYAMNKEIYWYTPIQADRQYGLVRYLGDRLDTAPIYYTMGNLTRELQPENSPIEIKVELPDKPVERNRKATIKLTAKNISNENRQIKFWPVGFVDGLGFTKLEDVRKLDWSGILSPNQEYEIVVEIDVCETADGKYKVGLAVVTDDNRNNLVLEDLYICAPALKAKVDASLPNNGLTEALNDFDVPVWSYDQDTDFLVWDSGISQTVIDDTTDYPDMFVEHWVQYSFDEPVTVSSTRVYWFDNSRPDYPIRGLNYDTHSAPQSWYLEYLSAGRWYEVEAFDSYGVDANRFNQVQFAPATSDVFRIKFILADDKGAGIGEWQLK